MSNVDKIRAEVERLKQITERRIDNNSYTINDIGLDDDERKRVHRLQDDKLTHLTGRLCMLDEILSFIDSLPKEPTTYVLDEAANDDCVNIRKSFVRVKNETDIFQGWGRIEKAKK